jgi:hypothetical protein
MGAGGCGVATPLDPRLRLAGSRKVGVGRRREAAGAPVRLDVGEIQESRRSSGIAVTSVVGSVSRLGCTPPEAQGSTLSDRR